MSPRVGGSSGCLTAPGGQPHAARGTRGQACVLLTRSSRPTAQPGVWAPARAHRDAASGAQGVPSDGCSWGPRPLLAAALLRWEGPSAAELPAPSPPVPSSASAPGWPRHLQRLASGGCRWRGPRGG